MQDEPVVFSSGELQLEGRLHIPPQGAGPFPGVVLCHPHPQYGGDMHNNVVTAMLQGMVSHGIAALRFNFRGVGRSQGAHGGGSAERDDVIAALAALRDRDSVDARRIGLGGYSFGASMALGAATQETELRALAVVAPPISGLNNPDVLKLSLPRLIVSGDLDHVAPPERIQALAKNASTPWAVETLYAGDHFLMGYEADIAERVGRFFAEHL